MEETGQVIGGYYLLQRLIKQGQYCNVYQGVDQRFQRMVAVKAVPAAQVSTYRAAVRLTAQFSYPNIVGLYDLAAKPDRLYLVHEYVEGEDFSALVQAQLQAHEVADIGRQICLALLYASSAARRVCHGDLTPSAVMRDRRGLIRVNNFALPGDTAYFTAWNALGGEGAPLADQELPWGVISEGRRADDVRAVGLLLYQLLTRRPAGAMVVEPPADGRLRFPQSVPADLCELVARTIIRQHPQHITKAEVLYEELKLLSETLEPAAPVAVSSPAYQRQQQAEVASPRQFSPSLAGNPGGSVPAGRPGAGSAAGPRGENSRPRTIEMEPTLNSALTTADAALRPMMVGQPVYPSQSAEEKSPPQRSYLFWLLLLGLLVFALFFAIGFFAGNLLIPPH